MGTVFRASPRAEPAGGAGDRETEADRQLIELLNELRVALPGAQVLLGFLLTVPFATRFGQVGHGGRIALFVGLLTAAGTILLMAPSVYHRLRWEAGGKGEVIHVGHWMFLAGTTSLAVGILAAVLLVTDVLFGTVIAVVSVLVLGAGSRCSGTSSPSPAAATHACARRSESRSAPAAADRITRTGGSVMLPLMRLADDELLSIGRLRSWRG